MPCRYDASTRAKAVRLVGEHAGDYPTEYAAITAVAGRLGRLFSWLLHPLPSWSIMKTRQGNARITIQFYNLTADIAFFWLMP